VIVTYAAPEGRRVVLADANPAIIALRTSTLLSLDEALRAVATGAEPEAATPGAASPRGPEPGASDPGAASDAGASDPGTSQPGAPPAPVPWSGPGEPPPNLGPPPERLDWRRPH
jgi:hypothetical protein